MTRPVQPLPEAGRRHPAIARRILITGAGGKLAPVAGEGLVRRGHEVVLVSRNAAADRIGLDELFTSDRLDRSDVLMHLGWSTLPATSDGKREQEADLPLLKRILARIEAIPKRQRPHFVFFSSGGAVYGNAPGRPNVEEDACRPIGGYGRAKRAAEEIIEAHAGDRGLDCAILRIANPYGYEVEENRPQGIIPRAIACALNNRPLTLWGDGSARKDFLYHEDFVAALNEVVDRRLTGIYNICSGISRRISEVVACVESHTGRQIEVVSTVEHPWDVRDSRLTPEKFHSATGWQPLTGFPEGIRRTVASMRAAANVNP